MPAAALALLLVAAVAHATWNFFAKGVRGSLAFTFAATTLAQIVYLPVAIVAFAITRPALGPEVWLFVIVSGALNAVYFVLLIEGYRFGDLSLVYPIARGTGPALAAPGAGRAVGLALLTGVCIASYTLWDNKGVTLITPVLYNYGLDGARAVILAPPALATRDARARLSDVIREQRTAIVAVAVLSPGAYILVLAALTLAPVSYVAPAREISILFGAILGLHLLKERDAARRLAGAGAIVAGIFALAIH